VDNGSQIEFVGYEMQVFLSYKIIVNNFKKLKKRKNENKKCRCSYLIKNKLQKLKKRKNEKKKMQVFLSYKNNVFVRAFLRYIKGKCPGQKKNCIF
jgi:hypothetical protein